MDDSMQGYLDSFKVRKLLTREEECDLGRIIHGSDKVLAKRAVNELVQANMRLALHVAKRYSNQGIELQDLVQEGTLGLFIAARKFDPERGLKFSTYAVPWIRQTVMRAIHNDSRIIRISVHISERIASIKKRKSELRLELGRNPTDDEVAARLKIPVEKVKDAVSVGRYVLSIDMTTRGNDDDEDIIPIINTGQLTPEEIAIGNESARQMQKFLSVLHGKDREVIDLHYGLTNGHEATFREIGEMFGVSHQLVHQRKKRALVKLKNYANSVQKKRSGPPKRKGR